MLNHTEIAAIAHEANRVYCLSLGDESQEHWEESEDWQRQSAINGVDNIANGTITDEVGSHVNWLEEKEREGWKWGSEKDTERKLHPCFMPFSELPKEQQFKDYLFYNTVKTLIKVANAYA
jgi:hypothetical protein